jgi:hypothetical protein
MIHWHVLAWPGDGCSISPGRKSGHEITTALAAASCLIRSGQPFPPPWL